MTPTISFCTSAMDRFDHLLATFPRNIEDNADFPACEFLLLDYSCPDPRTAAWASRELQPHIAAGRVNYYHYAGARFFSHSHARNLAFRLAVGDIVCNLDADNFAGPGFARYVAAQLADGKSFLRGPLDGRGLGGRICLWRTHWERVGGYDERMSGWGWEDVDLVNRLLLSGLTGHAALPETFCQTIPHGNELRMLHHAESNRRVSAAHNKVFVDENRANRCLCPNGASFGRGRVQKNFLHWLEA